MTHLKSVLHVIWIILKVIFAIGAFLLMAAYAVYSALVDGAHDADRRRRSRRRYVRVMCGPSGSRRR